MNHLSLFSGQGGFDLAAQWQGWNNVAHCEINEFCLKILKYYWPNATTHTDITKTDFSIYESRIDIVTGGFPCQPFSVAGLRKGSQDERHLWPEMLRAIRQIKSPFVLGENVTGIINWDRGVVFEQVQTDLEHEGYEVQTYILPAAGLGAPHARHRVWFIAYSHSNDARRRGYGKTGFKTCQVQTSKEEWQRFWPEFKRVGKKGTITHSDNIIRRSKSQIRMCQERTWSEPDRYNKITDANADSIRLERFKNKKKGKVSTFGNYWSEFPIESPICDGYDGISDRLDGITFSKWRRESIKSAGNSVSPPLVLRIFKAIESFKNLS